MELNPNSLDFSFSFVPERDVSKVMNQSRATTWKQVSIGELTPGVKISDRSTRWPSHEIEIIKAARLAGEPKEQIKELVKTLIVGRTQLFKSLTKALQLQLDSHEMESVTGIEANSLTTNSNIGEEQ